MKLFLILLLMVLPLYCSGQSVSSETSTSKTTLTIEENGEKMVFDVEEVNKYSKVITCNEDKKSKDYKKCTQEEVKQTYRKLTQR